MPTEPIPIVCDMTTAPDTIEERLAEYGRLFDGDLVGRERTSHGIVFTFRNRDGLLGEVLDLAAREKACCAFFTFEISEDDDEITWAASVVDDPAARQVLDEFYELPETVSVRTRRVVNRRSGAGEPDSKGPRRPDLGSPRR